MALINIKKNASNAYIEDVSFDMYKTNQALNHQVMKMDIMLTGMYESSFVSPDTKIAKMIIADMSKNAGKYPVDSKEFSDALTYIEERCKQVWKDCRKNVYDEKLYKKGYSILSKKFYEDICDGQINAALYVKAIMHISSRL